VSGGRHLFPVTSPGQADIEVIVPACNEERRIGATLHLLVDQLATMDLVATVRVIDNGSSDRTPDIVDVVSLATDHVTILLEGCSKPGKAGAVVRGMVTSHGRWVGYCDVGLPLPATSMSDTLSHLQNGWPIVFGYRGDADVGRPLAPRLGGRGYRLAARAAAGGLLDQQVGFTFFDGNVARSHFSRLRLTGCTFDLEVLLRAQALGLPIKPLPMAVADTSGPADRLKHVAGLARDVWRLRHDVPFTSFDAYPS
jgi:hypothetical protein